VQTGFQEHSLGKRPPDAILKGRKFAITADACAEAIARGVERDARTVVVPRIGWILIAANRLFPGFVDSRLAKINRNHSLA
jgi:hypothetical protein